MVKTEERYFVDMRTGCIAVRDRMYTDPEYQGLHEDTPGVVKYWHGKIGDNAWYVPIKFQEEALFLCKELNESL